MDSTKSDKTAHYERFEKWKPRPGRTPEEYLASVLGWLPRASIDAPDEGQVDNEYTALRMILNALVVSEQTTDIARALAAGVLLLDNHLADGIYRWEDADGNSFIETIAASLVLIEDRLATLMDGDGPEDQYGSDDA